MLVSDGLVVASPYFLCGRYLGNRAGDQAICNALGMMIVAGDDVGHFNESEVGDELNTVKEIEATDLDQNRELFRRSKGKNQMTRRAGSIPEEERTGYL